MDAKHSSNKSFDRSPQQLSLPGIERRERNPHMLFFAVLPPAEIAQRIALVSRRLRLEHRFEREPFSGSRLHISLQNLGDHREFPHELAALASHAAETIRATKFSATFDQALSFGGRSRSLERLPFVLAATTDTTFEFSRLKGAIDRAFGFRTRASLTPHITLLYDSKVVPRCAIEPLSWTVKEFALVHAQVRQSNQPKQAYSILGRWELR